METSRLVALFLFTGGADMGQHVEFIAEGQTIAGLLAFSNIPQGYQDLVIHYKIKSTSTIPSSAGAVAPTARFDFWNANYTVLQGQYIKALDQPEYNYSPLSLTYITLPVNDAVSTGAFARGWVKVYNYSHSNGTTIKSSEAFGTLPIWPQNTNNNGDNKVSRYMQGTSFYGDGPLESLTVTMSIGNFNFASKIRIYGIKDRF